MTTGETDDNTGQNCTVPYLNFKFTTAAAAMGARSHILETTLLSTKLAMTEPTALVLVLLLPCGIASAKLRITLLQK